MESTRLGRLLRDCPETVEHASPAASRGSSRLNRLVPTEGYSLAELDQAGLSIEQAEYLGLPWTPAALAPTAQRHRPARILSLQPLAFLSKFSLSVSESQESAIPRASRV